jgi:hypothetical protein
MWTSNLLIVSYVEGRTRAKVCKQFRAESDEANGGSSLDEPRDMFSSPGAVRVVTPN